MLEKQLTTLGFNKNEIKVYLALFELGKSRAKKIIDTTNLHRNLVYTSLEKLISKSLVSRVQKGGVFYFEANDPQAILDLIKKQEQIAKQVIKELGQKKRDASKNIKVFEGDEGIKRARERSLDLSAGDDVYILGASSQSSDPKMEKYWRRYHQKRVNKNINLKILYDRSTDKEILDWRNNLAHTQAGYLPFNIETPTWFEIYGNTVGVGVPGPEPLLFSFDSASAVESIKKYFEFFWKQEVVVETGMEVLKRTIYNMLDELDRGEEYLVLGASAGEHPVGVQDLYDRFHRERFKKGVITRMLVYKESYEKISNRFAQVGDPQKLISKIKMFSSAPPIPMQINIYKDKTFFIIYSDEPVVLHFDRKEVTDGFKSYFEELWSEKSTVYQSQTGLEIAYNSLVDIVDSETGVVIFAAEPLTDRSKKFNIEVAKKL